MSKDRADFTPDLTKCPPSSLELEESVLGAMLLDHNAALHGLQVLSPRDFYNNSLCLIFQAFGGVQLNDPDSEINSSTVANELTKRGKLEQIGGRTKLADLLGKVAHSLFLESEAKSLRQLAIRRGLIHAAWELDSSARDLSIDLDETTQRFGKIIEGAQEENVFRLAPWEITDFLARPVPAPWRAVDKVARQGSVTLLSAKPGTGKSLFTCTMALAVALGRPWLGRMPTIRMPVVICDFDIPRNGVDLQTRLTKLIQGHNLTEEQEQLHGQIRIVTKAHMRPRPDFFSGKGIGQLKQLIRDCGAGLVIIDTLKKVHEADENDNQQMDTVLETMLDVADDTGTAWVVNHHTRKAKQGEQDSGSDGVRGAGSIVSNCDQVFILKKGHQGIVEVRQEKERHDSKLESFGVAISSPDKDSLQLTYEGAEAIALNADDRTAAWLVTKFLPEHKDHWTTRTEIKQAAERDRQGSDQTVRQALRQLEAIGKVESRTGHNRALLYRLASQNHKQTVYQTEPDGASNHEHRDR